jgi:hypothetical protein
MGELSGQSYHELVRGTFEMHFEDTAAVLAHPRGRSVESGRAWFARVYYEHKCVAGADGPTLGAALLELEDEIRDRTGVEIREVLGHG